MKRFHWPLQRLLDVTCQRERSAQAGLLGLSRRIARQRQELLVHRASVRRLIAEAAAREFAERLRRHEEVMRCSDAHERKARRVEADLQALTAERKEKAAALLQLRRKREALERLREEARQEHVREQLKIEQRQFDESAHVGKARALARDRAAGAGTESEP
ncbi:MAG TPA: hypothetical protein VM695_11545 [Phycisphaerae bacterium]|nr:hypothetical protein [Phycisphaerae bacterium]